MTLHQLNVLRTQGQTDGTWECERERCRNLRSSGPVGVSGQYCPTGRACARPHGGMHVTLDRVLARRPLRSALQRSEGGQGGSWWIVVDPTATEPVGPIVVCACIAFGHLLLECLAFGSLNLLYTVFRIRF
jgi:hypothetical protein